MQIRDQVPCDSKPDPTDQESHGKKEQIVPPFQIDQRGEYVGQIAPASFVNIAT